MELFDLIQTLNAAHGPSGDEGQIRDVIARLAAPHADEVTTDVMGNLIVRKAGKGPKVMFAAHMDSIGLIVTHIEKDGFLRVGRLGGVSPKEAVFTPVRFKNGICGTFVKEEKAEFGKLKLDECYVDIGAKSEEEARELVQVGDTAVYDTPAALCGAMVRSPYLDNRISCAILLQALAGLTDCPRLENCGLGYRPGLWRGGGCDGCGRHPRHRAGRNGPAGQGSGCQDYGQLCDLSPGCGGEAGGDCRSGGDPGSAGYFAGRGNGCRFHPYHPIRCAHRRNFRALPLCPCPHGDGSSGGRRGMRQTGTGLCQGPAGGAVKKEYFWPVPRRGRVGGISSREKEDK